LDRNYEADITENRRLLALPSVEQFGLAITTDGATTQRHAMMNLIFDSRFLLRLSKVKDSTNSTNLKTYNEILLLINRCMAVSIC